MRVVRYERKGKIEHGVWTEDGIHSLSGDLFGAFSIGGEIVPPEQLRLLSPLRPNKLIAIGRNYAAHAAEGGKPVPPEPLMFLVSPTAVVGPEEPIRLPNREDRIDHEAELAVVIGKGGKNIPRGRATEHIFGYTCGNDVSNRVLQKKDGQYTRAKSFDTFKPLGPWIETDLDPSDLRVRLEVNGEVRQDGRTSDMVHSVPVLLESISAVFPLEPGDVILTGTPSGVGPLFPGDQVRVEVEGIGSLVNPVTG
ncbi:2-keto-4-pentenoate hydratase/2-oxohepta-3-ene-1,7-dioic acid hydratase in catechol pathway [Melghirimyces profundicolus]|uniref:2-keto-4-pentenoate hydratase/2-oxohepta-3-ene-1,7-dioic acid hydratase in catechol pathway n=1 Tax=Melghirimyces profundicolus TaxID=1242148 RepID=A0A2T6C9R3_9BACL|nr:fumarylacetoacetate hydrolase family protein [Melghirimyces profundicolus]PTX65061.1 2-keto-4-pentenoate hydratase/2-oxohepta-3-ene-1,7-dioic acid hydratase in catechol pathway [Melghirimyces profundicolus]